MDQVGDEKLVFIAYDRDDSKCTEYSGIEVYIIHANNIEEARKLCPIPPKSKRGDNPEFIIKQITNKDLPDVALICAYYE